MAASLHWWEHAGITFLAILMTREAIQAHSPQKDLWKGYYFFRVLFLLFAVVRGQPWAARSMCPFERESGKQSGAGLRLHACCACWMGTRSAVHGCPQTAANSTSDLSLRFNKVADYNGTKLTDKILCLVNTSNKFNLVPTWFHILSYLSEYENISYFNIWRTFTFLISFCHTLAISLISNVITTLINS